MRLTKFKLDDYIEDNIYKGEEEHEKFLEDQPVLLNEGSNVIGKLYFANFIVNQMKEPTDESIFIDEEGIYIY